MTGRQAQFNPKSRIDGMQICVDCVVDEFYGKNETEAEVESGIPQET